MSVLSLSNVRSEGGLLPHGFDKPVDAVQDGAGRDVRGIPLLRHVLHGHAGVVYQAGHAQVAVPGVDHLVHVHLVLELDAVVLLGVDGPAQLLGGSEFRDGVAEFHAPEVQPGTATVFSSSAAASMSPTALPASAETHP